MDLQGFDSKEELYFSWWLEELRAAGYVEFYEKSGTYTLSEGMKELKLRDHKYKPDFDVYWTEDGLKLAILRPSVGRMSVVEVKGEFDAKNMTRLFKINQKWMYANLGIYVNLVKIPKLFEDTFTPFKYLSTDMGKQERKLKFVPKTLDEYIKDIEYQREGIQKSRKR